MEKKLWNFFFQNLTVMHYSNPQCKVYRQQNVSIVQFILMAQELKVSVVIANN